MAEPNKVNFDFLSNLTPMRDEEIEQAERILAEEKRKERKISLESDYFYKSNVPKRYLKESLETYHPAKENEGVYKWVKGFVKAAENKENTKNLIYLNGTFGSGKSHLGCGIIRELGGYIMTSLELCITYDSCRDFKATETRIQFLKRICQYKVLVIDEIGKGIERIEKEIMPYIVNEFYGSGNILIFLGNGSRSDFNAVIGEAGVDRFAESGVYLALTGESMRGKK